MLRRSVPIISSSCLGLAVLMVLTGCAAKPMPDPVQTSASTDGYMYNTEDPASVVGAADYVFSARVISDDGVLYEGKTTAQTSTGPVEIDTPFSYYSVQVERNIKAKLRTDLRIPIQKFGGYSPELNEVFVEEGGILPQEGESYIFIADALPDGSLQVVGRNSVILRTADSTIINTYIDAVANQQEIPRERYTSIYEQR